MPQADVLQLVQDLTDGLADATAATNFYSDVVYSMATDVDSTLVNIATIDPGAGTPATDMPAAAVVELAMVYDKAHLSKANVEEATAYDVNWRATLGRPRVWITEDESKHTVALVPVPASPPTLSMPRDPTSQDPGAYSLTVLYT
jgi:hypothetical protein